MSKYSYFLLRFIASSMKISHISKQHSKVTHNIQEDKLELPNPQEVNILRDTNILLILLFLLYLI